MPLGFERLNERTQRPNALINFIRPLPGPTSDIATSILNRVAAICYPFMKSNMVLVQALEEFPYNREFVGRNFNAGEVIQLVLKDRHGRWLPQRMVEMVMVHELAHCKQMNHSKAFWKVRDAYAVDLKALWGGGYTGEGMWGRGRALETGAVQQDSVDPMDMPEHLCGGTYGRRSRKRRRTGKGKEQPKASYAERKQRRILKKFGAGGQALGADDNTKAKLEGRSAKKSKPRVAGSARGRELRAAAALARFDTTKKAESEVKEKTPSDSDTEDDDEVENGEAAIDVDGKKMRDEKGRILIKICEDGDDDKDGNAQREMDEIESLQRPKREPDDTTKPISITKIQHQPSSRAPKVPTSKSIDLTGSLDSTCTSYSATTLSASKASSSTLHSTNTEETLSKQGLVPTTVACAVCSLVNQPGSITCMVCSNVLNPDLVADNWTCNSEACRESIYINAGDAGGCGICGASRS